MSAPVQVPRASAPRGNVRSAVVVGGGAAGLTAAWALARQGVDVRVLESSDRLGGLVETEHTDGFVIEHGPDAILDARPGARPVLEALGVSSDLVREGPAPRRVYVAAAAGRLVPLPEGLSGLVPRAPFALFRSPLLSTAAKARLLVEPLIAPDAVERRTSVARLVERRMGREPRVRLVDPMLRAIYGVTSEALDLDATMPHLRAMLREHGSLGLGVLRAAGRPAPPGLAALRGGMEGLVARLVAAVGVERIALRTAVTEITRGARGGYRIATSGGSLDADAVVVAVPAPIAASLVARLAPELAVELAAVPHVDADVVTLAYDRGVVGHPLDGTGHVVAIPGARTRACTWTSMKWHGRAPQGAVLFRSVLDPTDASERETIELARLELEPLLDIRARPRLTRIRRRRAALPVPAVGHLERRARIAAHARDLGRFHLAGSAAGGLGVPECLASGAAAVGVLEGMRVESGA